jgi:hypothetical protein
LKQDREIVVTDDGRQIEVSDEQEVNADRPRIESLEPLSNATTNRLWQPWKHRSPIASVDDGMQIDANDDEQNAN